MAESSDYDARYLAGIVLFNRGDHFEAHEVWEELWHHSAQPERRFYQGLIQAAVGLCHFYNGNLRGASKLYHSSKDYMQPFHPIYLGMNVTDFWQQMDRCFAELLAGGPEAAIELKDELCPQITLEPAPETWPDPAGFLPEED